ncbi:MAG TPA: CD225/dispanin family protein [Ornithinibacter sp.]|nr:CD225/dispanin family protein [Ornithinibacter sp.]
MSDAGPPPPPPPYGSGGGYAAPPPPPLGGGAAAGPPDNKLVWSILVTLFCCLPFGIVAIIKSAEVNSKWNAGDVAGAQQSAADAGKWIKWSVIAGVLLAVLYIVFVVLLGSLASSN